MNQFIAAPLIWNKIFKYSHLFKIKIVTFSISKLSPTKAKPQSLLILKKEK